MKVSLKCVFHPFDPGIVQCTLQVLSRARLLPCQLLGFLLQLLDRLLRSLDLATIRLDLAQIHQQL